MVILLVLVSCEEAVYAPKPFGYQRIDYGAHAYVPMTPPGCPYSFEVGQGVRWEPTTTNGGNSCWYNLVYPHLKAKVHMSYFEMDKAPDHYIEDARKLAMKHLVKADNYEEFYINDTTANVYGVVYDFSGRSASNMQFYLTDSTRHFVRGALYFEVIPNADSLAPAEQYIETEIQQLVGSLKWLN